MSMLVNPSRFDAAGGLDPDFASVVLLCHFDGADGSTAFTDVTGKTMTTVGNAQVDTAQSKFGGASGLFDGTGDRITLADSADWEFTGAFTMEMFVRHTTKNNTTTYITQWSNAWAFYIESGQLKFRAIVSGFGLRDIVYTWAPTLGQWYHICAEKNASGKMRLYIDGVMVASDATNFTPAITNSTEGVAIGAIGTVNSFGGFDFNGHMDELRITKGVARYNTDTSFTVPTAAFPDS